MNPKISKIIDEIERTKAKIAELQALLPELDRKRVDLENSEIIKLVRSASIAPADLPEFLAAIKEINSGAPAFAETQTTARVAPNVSGRPALTEREDDTDE
jgi:hypothetical protein